MQYDSTMSCLKSLCCSEANEQSGDPKIELVSHKAFDDFVHRLISAHSSGRMKLIHGMLILRNDHYHLYDYQSGRTSGTGGM